VGGEPYISVVVPVHDGGTQLGLCLDALLASDWRDRELIVVDDCSTDGSAELAEARGATVLRMERRGGPAVARNAGARRARGHVLLFVDADVVVRRNTLARVARTFRKRAGVAAVFGSYDDAPAERNLVSRFKNFFHHFVHQRSSAEASTFWSGCGAVRRAAFESVGGFDERRYSRPSVEDIELGRRLRLAGHRIVLDKQLQVKHLKRWTLRSLVATDIARRAVPWSRLILEGGSLIDDLNLRVSDRVSAALTGLAALALLASPLAPAPLLVVALAALLAVFRINRELYGSFFRLWGARAAAAAFALHLLYYLYSGTVFGLCFVAHRLSKLREAARPATPARTSAAHVPGPPQHVNDA
jgi:GT2 family glycosyltransferase